MRFALVDTLAWTNAWSTHGTCNPRLRLGDFATEQKHESRVGWVCQSSCPVLLRYAASCRLGPIFTWKAAVNMQCPDSRSAALAYHSYPPIYLSDINIVCT